MTKTDTSTPRCARVLATTNPSPPLFPRPHSTATGRSSRSPCIASIAATTCRPAFSIRTSDGMPTSSIVRRSASRICAEFSTRIAIHQILPAGPAIVSMAPFSGGLAVGCDGTLESMAATVNVNGRIFDQEHALVSVFDHGFLYGEGVYETLRTYDGQPFLFDRHMRRLRNSAEMLALPVPMTNEQIDARFRETVRAAGLGDGPDREAYIRILVTRGIGELTYDPVACPTPSIVVILKRTVPPSPEAFEGGFRGSPLAVGRNHPGSVTPWFNRNNL